MCTAAPFQNLGKEIAPQNWISLKLLKDPPLVLVIVIWQHVASTFLSKVGRVTHLWMKSLTETSLMPTVMTRNISTGQTPLIIRDVNLQYNRLIISHSSRTVQKQVCLWQNQQRWLLGRFNCKVSYTYIFKRNFTEIAFWFDTYHKKKYRF